MKLVERWCEQHGFEPHKNADGQVRGVRCEWGDKRMLFMRDTYGMGPHAIFPAHVAVTPIVRQRGEPLMTALVPRPGQSEQSFVEAVEKCRDAAARGVDHLGRPVSESERHAVWMIGQAVYLQERAQASKAGLRI